MIDTATALAMVLMMQAAAPATAPQADPPRAASPDGYEPPVPVGNQGDWFPYEAYPVQARRAGQQGRVVMKLSVDEDGKPSGCMIVESSGFASLDSSTCEMAMRNARFSPARQRSRPVPSTYQLRGVRWALADNNRTPTLEVGDEPSVLINDELEISLTAKGSVAGCTIVRHDAVVGNPCEGFPIGKVIFPPLTHKDMPTIARARYVTTVTILPAK